MKEHKTIKDDSHLLFENHPLPMYIAELDTKRFLAVNEAATKHYGYTRDEFLKMTIFDIRTAEDAALLKERMAAPSNGQDRASGTWHHQKKDGTVITVEITHSNIEYAGRAAFLVVIHDVTDRIRYDEAFRQSTKMEAVGRLAGGIAHDFNNVLTIILGYCNMTLDQLTPQDALRPNIEGIRKAADRAALLTRQMLAFSRRQVLQPKILDLNAIVADTSKLIERIVGEDIELITSLGSELSPVKVDPSQIEQILMTLAMNARDAMPNGGRVVIETRNIELDGHYAQGHVSAAAGKYVLLSVADDGAGIDKETRLHLFEPFFTTKQQGNGTGLGLAMVYGIVKQSGGNIWVYSEPGHGTTFKIYLPVAQGVEKRRPKVHTAVIPKQGTETILVAEDEQELRAMARSLLTRVGYRVIEAVNGEDALSIAGGHQGRIDLLLSDVIMPRIGGRELARRLAVTRPETKVIFMSGYGSDAVVQHGELEPGIVYIEKPFSVDLLMQKVRDVLDGKFD